MFMCSFVLSPLPFFVNCMLICFSVVSLVFIIIGMCYYFLGLCLCLLICVVAIRFFVYFVIFMFVNCSPYFVYIFCYFVLFALFLCYFSFIVCFCWPLCTSDEGWRGIITITPGPVHSTPRECDFPTLQPCVLAAVKKETHTHKCCGKNCWVYLVINSNRT